MSKCSKSLSVWCGTLPLLAGLCFPLTAFSQTTTTTSSSASSASSESGYSTFDVSLFGGAQWFQLYQGNRALVDRFASGGIIGARINEDPWKYVGLEQGFSYGFNNLLLVPFQDGVNVEKFGIGARNYNASLTVLAYFTPRDAKFRPFFTVGPGYTWYDPTRSTQQAPGGPIQYLHTENSPALVYGLGMKLNTSKRFGFRVDVRDTYTKRPNFALPNFPVGVGALYIPSGGTEHALSATLGITFRMRYHEEEAAAAATTATVHTPPPPPPAVQVGAIEGAHDVCPGEPEHLQVTASGWGPNQTPNYQWMVDGQPVSGATGATFDLPTSDVTGGASRSVSVRVSVADSSQTSQPVSVRVKDYHVPTVQFSVSPTTIPAGATLPLNATASGSECGGQVTITYTASEGTVTGTTYDSTGVAFDMSNRAKPQSKVVHLTATAKDEKGGTGTGTADVTVTLKSAAQRLDDLVFPANSARVNNCGKRLLLEVVTPMLRDDPNAKVILIGHRDARERGRGNASMDRVRVLNAAAVLSAGTGICPQLELSRVSGAWVGGDQTSPTKPSFCGTSTNVREKSGQNVTANDPRAQYRRVEVWVVPGGADMPAEAGKASELPAREVKAKGCPH